MTFKIKKLTSEMSDDIISNKVEFFLLKLKLDGIAHKREPTLVVLVERNMKCIAQTQIQTQTWDGER